MSVAIGIIILVLLGAIAVYIWRLKRFSESESSYDTGQAILDFARAFPNEAIRSLHMTADGNAVFVRLHDNKAGFMRNMGKHNVCMMLNPERITVEHLESGDGFVVSFIDTPKYSGAYRFKTIGEAAEVSLWLLGSYLEAAESVPDHVTEAASNSSPSPAT